MNSTFLYSHQKPLTAHSPFNKENLSAFFPKRPSPIQTPNSPPFFVAPFTTTGTLNARSPFAVKVNASENRGHSVHRFDADISRVERLEANEPTERFEKPEFIVPSDILKVKSSGPTEYVGENAKLRKLLIEKSAESEELKRKLCDERVERKIANKKLESFQAKIKDLLAENEKLNQTLNSRLEQTISRQIPKNILISANDARETLTSKETENRLKALSQENERLFAENQSLQSQVAELKTLDSQRMIAKSHFDTLAREKDDLQAQLQPLESQIEQLKGQLEQYKSKSKDLETELVQSHVCISDLEKRIKSMLPQESLNSSCLSLCKRGGEEEIRLLKSALGKYRQEGTKIQEILENRRKEIDLLRKELDKVKRENRKLIKLRLDWEENLDRERKEKEEYKELIENQSVILREKELELDEKLIEIDEIKKGFLDLSAQNQGI